MPDWSAELLEPGRKKDGFLQAVFLIIIVPVRHISMEVAFVYSVEVRNSEFSVERSGCFHLNS